MAHDYLCDTLEAKYKAIRGSSRLLHSTLMAIFWEGLIQI